VRRWFIEFTSDRSRTSQWHDDVVFLWTFFTVIIIINIIWSLILFDHYFIIIITLVIFALIYVVKPIMYPEFALTLLIVTVSVGVQVRMLHLSLTGHDCFLGKPRIHGSGFTLMAGGLIGMQLCMHPITISFSAQGVCAWTKMYEEGICKQKIVTKSYLGSYYTCNAKNNVFSIAPLRKRL